MPSTSWRIWIQAARPRTLPAAIAPVVIGTVMAISDQGFHLIAAMAALCGALLIQVGTNLANDYFDYKKGTDREDRLGPQRITQAGLVQPRVVMTAAMIAFGLALVIGIYLVVRGGWPIVVIGLSSILFGILYTGGPIPVGYVGLGDLFVLLFFGPVAVGGSYYVQTLAINYDVILAGLAPGLISVAILTVNNLRDIDTDRESGKRTLAVRFGSNFAVVEYCATTLMAVAIPILLAFRRDTHAWVVLGSLALLPAIFLMIETARLRGRDLNPLLGQTGQLLLIYAVLFSLGWLL